MYFTGANGQLFGWAESTWLWLDQFGILLGDITLVVGVPSAIWAFFHRDAIRRWLALDRFPLSGREADDNAQWDALVFTVSRPELPEWVVKQRKPRAVALLATDQSWEQAKSLANFASARGVALLGPKKLDDPDDPAEARAETERLIERLHEKGYEKIGVDVTGGKTPMSIGAFLAAREMGCDTLYVTSEFNQKLKKPMTHTAKLRCITHAKS